MLVLIVAIVLSTSCSPSTYTNGERLRCLVRGLIDPRTGGCTPKGHRTSTLGTFDTLVPTGARIVDWYTRDHEIGNRN